VESQFYQQIIDSISEALITIDQDRKILVWNSAAEAIFGYQKAEVQEQSLDLIIFQPYVTHGKKSGSGPGLYAAKLILAKVHGWQLTFESNSDKGTIFRIVFGPSK
jgi:PAS domain-containing protein